MTQKKRKGLNDSLANEFVYGNSSREDSKEEDSKEEKPPTTNKDKSKLMDKLQAESKEGTKRFTVDLPESTHRKLSILAAKTGRTKADIVRILINDALEDIPED